MALYARVSPDDPDFHLQVETRFIILREHARVIEAEVHREYADTGPVDTDLPRPKEEHRDIADHLNRTRSRWRPSCGPTTTGTRTDGRTLQLGPTGSRAAVPPGDGGPRPTGYCGLTRDQDNRQFPHSVQNQVGCLAKPRPILHRDELLGKTPMQSQAPVAGASPGTGQGGNRGVRLDAAHPVYLRELLLVVLITVVIVIPTVNAVLPVLGP